MSKNLFKDLAQNNLNISQVLKSSDKVVLYFNNDVCTSCLISLIMDFEILADKIGSENILLAGYFENNIEFENFIAGIKTNLNYVLVGEIKFADYASDQPVIFIFDKDKEINSLYFPLKYPEIKKIYFDKILPFYFETYGNINSH